MVAYIRVVEYIFINPG